MLSALNLTSEFENVINKELPSLTFTLLRPSTLSINTMTIVCTTNLQSFMTKINDIKEYITKYPLGGGIVLSEKSMKNNALVFSWVQKYDDGKKDKNISAKVFGNGCIHITGVTSPYEAVLVSNYFCTYFGKLDEKMSSDESQDIVNNDKDEGEEDEDDFETTEIKICMIQSNFDLGITLDLRKVVDMWGENETNTSVNYNAEKFHALNIRFVDIKVTSLIFSSGKVLITGAKEPSHLQKAYTTICDFFNKKRDIVFREPVTKPVRTEPAKRGRKRKVDQMEMYNNLDI